MHVRAVVTLVLAGLTLGAAGATACGDGSYENLVAPVTLHGNLRATYLNAHPRLTSAEVSGPIAGHTYYGSDQGDIYYAVATFQVAGHPAHPSVFWRHRKAWRFVRETHGGISDMAVPAGLKYEWGFAQWPRNQQLWVETA
jgi:hypothetical protein